jgi:hypothetical protein
MSAREKQSCCAKALPDSGLGSRLAGGCEWDFQGGASFTFFPNGKSILPEELVRVIHFQKDFSLHLPSF